MVMIHDAWDLTIGNQDDHIAAADLLGKASNNLSQHLRQEDRCLS